jgi:hypothetical protein
VAVAAAAVVDLEAVAASEVGLTADADLAEAVTGAVVEDEQATALTRHQLVEVSVLDHRSWPSA